jgi:hypothetical protein
MVNKIKDGEVIETDDKTVKGEEKFHVRDHKIKGVRDNKWLWPKGEKKRWETYIQKWNDSHSYKFFDRVKNFDVAVVLGGNFGLDIRGYVQRGFKFVYVFEPNHENFYTLCRNTADLNNVFKFHATLNDEPGICQLIDNEKVLINEKTINIPNIATIPMITIDSLNLWECDLIQLNAGNREREILIGAYDTIIKHRPVIIIENKDFDTLDYMRYIKYVTLGTSEENTIWIHSNPNV